MLFDDPVETSTNAVSELTIPKEPTDASAGSAQALPQSKGQVLGRSDTELSVSEEELDQEPSVSGVHPTDSTDNVQADDVVMEAGSEAGVQTQAPPAEDDTGEETPPKEIEKHAETQTIQVRQASQ